MLTLNQLLKLTLEKQPCNIKQPLVQCYTKMLLSKYVIPYKNKYWRGTKFGKLVNHQTIAKFKSNLTNIFSIVY